MMSLSSPPHLHFYRKPASGNKLQESTRSTFLIKSTRVIRYTGTHRSDAHKIAVCILVKNCGKDSFCTNKTSYHDYKGLKTGKKVKTNREKRFLLAVNMVSQRLEPPRRTKKKETFNSLLITSSVLEIIKSPGNYKL